MSVKKTVVTYSSSMLLGDEPMRMRLLPPLKYDDQGNRIHDGKKRKWYAHFFWKGEEISNTLNAYEHETRKAQIELGKLMEKLENGEVVGRGKDTMISGNAYNVLNQLIELGSDSRWLGGGLKTPSIMVNGVSISSKG